MPRIAYRRGFTIVELLIVVVVIAILAAITTVSYNGLTNRAKAVSQASELASWKKLSEIRKADKGITCPENYSFVYGSSVLGTDDFCVMKYEAKNVGGVATSQASGAPWASISQTNAIEASTATGGHLITDAEWMTIAADVLSVKYNWSGGEVGSGIIYQGHVNNYPTGPLAASTDDTNVHYGMTDGIGTTSGQNNSRVLYLSSGDVIWDFSGNVSEFTQQAIGTPTLVVSGIGANNWAYYDYTTSGLFSFGNMAMSSRPTTLNSWTNPINGVSLAGINWGAGKGVGRMYANSADVAERAFARGGSWSGRDSSGVVTLYLPYSPTNSYADLGFRVARSF